MMFIKKAMGKVVYGLAKVVAALLDWMVYATETLVLMAKSFLKGCALLISMGGCFFFLLIIGPFGAWLLRNPGIFLLFLVILFVPITGALFITYLKYLKFITTAYLFNLANHWMEEAKHPYRSFGYYKEAYRKAEEERIERERRRRYEEQKAWEERFNQWNQWQQQGTFGGQGGFYGGSGRQGGYGQSGYGQSTANPYEEFKNKYRKSCQVLGVSEDTDQYKVKLAYRKMAKTYHPDVNQDSGATKKFQEINDAYEFLNEDNIQRYRQMNH